MLAVLDPISYAEYRLMGYTIILSADTESRHWYLNGVRHREDGPAVEYSEGTKHWYLNGVRHREDGPASEYSSGGKYWYLNGVHQANEN